MKTNLCGRAVVSVSLARKKKSYFKIIPRAPKIEQTRVKKKKGGKVTNYFYNSIESARYFISKGFPRLFCIIQNSIRLSRFNPPYEIRNTSCNTEESTSKCTRKKIKNSQTRSISESLKKKTQLRLESKKEITRCDCECGIIHSDKCSRGRVSRPDETVVLWLMQATRVLYHNNATQRVFEARLAAFPLQVLSCLDTHAHACTRDETTVRGEFLDEIIFFPRDAIRLSSLMRPIPPSLLLDRVSRFSDSSARQG